MSNKRTKKYTVSDSFDIDSYKNNNSKSKKKILLYSLLVVLFVFFGTFFITKSFSVLNELNITYKEKSNLDYKVYLKNNEFYESDYLGKGMVYVASLIDKIDVDFDYIFNIDEKSNINFEYDIMGKLIITDNNKKNTFYEKDYVLLKSTKDSMDYKGEHEIKKKISIDYDYYNDIANKFRVSYGVDTVSNFIVYLNIHETNDKSNKFNFNNDSTMSLTIPLSQKAINIYMDYNEINRTSKILRDESIVISNYAFIVIGIIFSLLALFFFVKLVRILLKFRKKKSKYDKYINKILNEYDRLIVETSTKPNLNDVNIVNINKFQELLDVRDNLRLPIKYYVVEDHKECNFYINHEDELYLLEIKDSDF